jgi:hypothetical protein
MEVDNAKVKSNSNGINILSFLLNIKSEIITRQNMHPEKYPVLQDWIGWHILWSWLLYSELNEVTQ